VSLAIAVPAHQCRIEHSAPLAPLLEFTTTPSTASVQ
jgi:hypothetical protein